MKRPTIILHLLSSLDERISGAFFGEAATGDVFSDYATLRTSFHAEAVCYGTVTARELFGDSLSRFSPAGDSAPEDYARTSTSGYVVVLDADGTLAWNRPVLSRAGLDNARIIEILSPEAPAAKRAYLKEHDVSYVTAKTLAEAMEKLSASFGISKILLLGGGGADTAFASEDLIDELSIVVSPVIDGGTGALLFAPTERMQHHSSYTKADVKPLTGAGLWIHYTR